MSGAPCESAAQALRTMDFPSKERFLFIGGPLDGKRCHVEMTTHGPDNILYMREAAKIPAPSAENFLQPIDEAAASEVKHAYIRHPMHEREGKIHFIYQHEGDRRNIIAALIEGYAKP